MKLTHALFRRSALAVAVLVLAGCASTTIDQAITDTNDANAASSFTTGKLELSRTDAQQQARRNLSD